MAMTKTYTSRPPASAPTARRAWDHFAAKYPSRTIETLAYSPSCDGVRGWIAELNKPEGATKCWGAGYWDDWYVKTIPAYELAK